MQGPQYLLKKYCLRLNNKKKKLKLAFYLLLGVTLFFLRFISVSVIHYAWKTLPKYQQMTVFYIGEQVLTKTQTYHTARDRALIENHNASVGGT